MQRLIKQFDFELWANKAVVEAIESIGNEDERILFLLSHSLSAHSIWLSRILGENPTCALFEERTLEQCKQLMIANTNAWKAYLSNVNDEELDREIQFVFFVDNTTRKLSIYDAVMHLINHSSYHRGQIVARMKGKLPELPLTTYITYASALV